jgi:shikimate kinase
MHLILIGFQGVGKTTLGKALSRCIKRPFFDTDALIVEAYKKKCGTSATCSQIVEDKGIVFFQSLEKEMIRNLTPTEPSIIAVGGGSIMDEENLSFLQKLGKLVYLQASKNRIEQAFRLKHVSFDLIYAKRLVTYAQVADAIVDIENKEESQLLEELCLEIPSEPSLK